MGLEEIEGRLHQYCTRRGIVVKQQLGLGNDGGVWRTQSTAVKVYWPERRAAFETEVLCYQRLAERNVTQILGFAIPRMVAFDASLLVVEMDFVSRPSLLDFGKAKLDTPPQDDFSDVEAVQVDMQEKWGSKLPLVRKIVWHLQTLGIYYLDPQPGNINFVDDDEEL